MNACTFTQAIESPLLSSRHPSVHCSSPPPPSPPPAKRDSLQLNQTPLLWLNHRPNSSLCQHHSWETPAPLHGPQGMHLSTLTASWPWASGGKPPTNTPWTQQHLRGTSKPAFTASQMGLCNTKPVHVGLQAGQISWGRIDFPSAAHQSPVPITPCMEHQASAWSAAWWAAPLHNTLQSHTCSPMCRTEGNSFSSAAQEISYPLQGLRAWSSSCSGRDFVARSFHGHSLHPSESWQPQPFFLL